MTEPQVLPSSKTLREVREALDQIETTLTRLKGSGAAALEILFLMDQVADSLKELKVAGAQVQAEHGRLASAWQGLQRRAQTFLQEAGHALQAEREHGRATTHPWWLLDQAQTRLQRQVFWTRAKRLLAIVLIIVAGGLLYQRFLAPPREVRQALVHVDQGEKRLQVRDLAGALAEFEAAALLLPQDAEILLWVGVVHQEMGEIQEAEAVYQTVRDLGIGDVQFYFQRGTLFLQADDLVSARADAEKVIALDAEWGYGFYLRASVKAAAGEISAAVEDYQLAVELAHTAEDVELEAMARAQIGLLIQVPEGQ